MKSIILSFIALLLTLSSFAQVPQKFNYQAVVRNNTGVIVTNQNIAVKAEIIDSNSTTILYSETHTVTTNAQGLFALQVGGGSAKSGVFANIDWSAGNRYIRTSVDLTGGTNFQLIGTSQLLSVPYALQAKNISISRVGNSDSIYFGDKLLIIPGVKVVNTTPDINTGLVAYYPFTGNANDSSGYGNHGTVYGATLTIDRFGNPNSAYSFDGISNYVNTTYQETNLTSLAVSVWVKTIINYNGLDEGYPIIQNRGPLDNGRNVGKAAITLNYFGNGGWGYILDGDYIQVGQKIPFQNNNQWLHLVGIWQTTAGNSIKCSDFKIYINGILQSTNGSNCSQFGGNSSNSPINGIGTMKIAYHEAWNAYFKGDIDDIRIYNRALSQEEITYLATH